MVAAAAAGGGAGGQEGGLQLLPAEAALLPPPSSLLPPVLLLLASQLVQHPLQHLDLLAELLLQCKPPRHSLELLLHLLPHQPLLLQPGHLALQLLHGPVQLPRLEALFSQGPRNGQDLLLVLLAVALKLLLPGLDFPALLLDFEQLLREFLDTSAWARILLSTSFTLFWIISSL